VRGTLDIRLQTNGSVFGAGALFSPVAVPGIAYSPDTDQWSVNVSGGLGWFIRDDLAVGGDLALQFATRDVDEVLLLSAAPFAKWVSRFACGRHGLFAEPSAGLLIVTFGGTDAYAQATGWAGGHLWLTGNTAIQVGPFASVLHPVSTDSSNETATLVGVRFGLSIYSRSRHVPEPPRPPPAPPRARRPDRGIDGQSCGRIHAPSAELASLHGRAAAAAAQGDCARVRSLVDQINRLDPVYNWSSIRCDARITDSCSLPGVARPQGPPQPEPAP